jgi:hypothetical protein
MNRTQANVWRVAQGLSPIVVPPEQAALEQARKRAAAANKAARAQASRDMKSKRGTRSK